MLTFFLDIKGHISIDFLEKGATVSSASYCQLRQNSPNSLNDTRIERKKERKKERSDKLNRKKNKNEIIKVQNEKEINNQ